MQVAQTCHPGPVMIDQFHLFLEPFRLIKKTLKDQVELLTQHCQAQHSLSQQFTCKRHLKEILQIKITKWNYCAALEIMYLIKV